MGFGQWANNHLPFGKRDPKGMPRQSSLKGASLIDPNDYQAPALTPRKNPYQPALRMPANAGPIRQMKSGWIEDDTDDFQQTSMDPGAADYSPMGVTEKIGYDIRPGAGLTPVFDNAIPVATPQPVRQLGPSPEVYEGDPHQRQGAMDMMGGFGSQRRIGGLFNNALDEYSSMRRQQWDDAHAARKQSRWDGLIQGLVGPGLGALGVDPTLGMLSMQEKMKRNNAASVAYDPSVLLKDAKTMAELGQMTDPESLKNQRLMQQTETERQRGMALQSGAESKRLTAESRAKYLQERASQGWSKEERENFKADVWSDLQNGKLDTMQAKTLMQQAESEAKVERTKADTDRIVAGAAKTRDDITMNHSRLQQSLQRLELDKQKLELLKHKATDMTQWKQLDLMIKQRTAEQRNNYNIFRQNSLNQYRAHQVNEHGKLKAPEFDDWIDQLENAPNPFGEDGDLPPLAPIPYPQMSKPKAKPGVLMHRLQNNSTAPQAKPKPAAKGQALSENERAARIAYLKGRR